MDLSKSVAKEIQDLARENDIEKLILFGSRARGDAHRTSDIDLAAYGGNISRFSIDLEEEVNTLLFFDCVDMSLPIRDELREAIEQEGVLIYEKP